MARKIRIISQNLVLNRRAGYKQDLSDKQPILYFSTAEFCMLAKYYSMIYFIDYSTVIETKQDIIVCD